MNGYVLTAFQALACQKKTDSGSSDPDQTICRSRGSNVETDAEVPMRAKEPFTPQSL